MCKKTTTIPSTFEPAGGLARGNVTNEWHAWKSGGNL
jgi:hypothetical protein